jgi:serine/threonine-protein kinase
VRDLGRYRILERLASGGMADVYRAEVSGAEGVRKEVALKLVRADHATSPDLAARFVREARLAARLTHANIVQIFEFDRVDGRHFIAMELVRGHHLGQLVERCRELGLRFGVARAVHLAAEVATALAYAHQPGENGEPGLVHRDVSPHNVLISWEGEVKLADFGIARAASGGLTVPGTLEGKLAYVAPEQARGEAVDAGADLFALGVVLWELLAGARLFARESEAATLEVLLRGPIPSPPSAWNEGIPPALDALVLRCLERSRAARPSSAREVADALRTLLLELSRSPADWELRAFMRRLWPEGPGAGARAADATVRRPPADPEPPEPPVPVAAEPSGDETRTLARRPGRGVKGRGVAAAAATVLAAALGGALMATRGGPVDRHDPGSSSAAPSSPVSASTARAAAVAAPARDAAARVEPPPAPAAPAERSGRVLGAGSPAPATGEGLLVVNATPWGTLLVDGRRVGDTPREVRLPAGSHRVRVEHPRLGAVDATVEIAPGRRTAWFPRIQR